MSNEFVGGLDDNIVDIPDILEPKVGFNIRNPIELFFEESLPASLYQYFTGNTKAKQAEEARKKLRTLDPNTDEWKESFRIYNKFGYLLPDESGEKGSFDIKEVAKFVASNPEMLASEMVNAILADPYLLFIPFLGWGKLGANTAAAIGVTGAKGQKLLNAGSMFATGAALGTAYGGILQLGEDADIDAKRTLAEATIGGTANLMFGAMIAGLGTKVAKATGDDPEKVGRKIYEAASKRPEDPIADLDKAIKEILDEMDAPQLQRKEVEEMVNFRYKEELNKAKNDAIRGNFNWKVAASLGGIGAFSGFLTAKDEKLLAAAAGTTLGLVPFAFNKATQVLTRKRTFDEQKIVRSNELQADELTAALDGGIKGVEVASTRLGEAIRSNFSERVREAMVFAVQNPSAIASDGTFVWQKFNKDTLMKARNLRDQGNVKAAQDLIDSMPTETIKFSKKELDFIKNQLPDYFEVTRNKMVKDGFRFGYVKNYLAQEWELGPTADTFALAQRFDKGEKTFGQNVLNLIGASGGIGKYGKSRIIPNYKEGIELGYIPRTNNQGDIDIADIVTRYSISMGKADIERKTINEFTKFKFPGLGTQAIHRSFADIPDDLKTDFVAFNHPSINKRIYKNDVLDREEIAFVHKSVKPYIQMVMDATDPPALVKHSQNINFLMKRFAVGASFFHAVSLGESMIFTFLRDGAMRNYTGKLFKDSVTGRKSLMQKWTENPNDPSFKKWMESEYVATTTRLNNDPNYRDVIQLLTKNGLEINKPADVGHDQFYASFNQIERAVSKIPALGKVMNDLGVRPARSVFKWFDKVTWERAFTSFKLHTAIAQMNKQILRDPEGRIPLRIHARDAAEFTNDAFGGQNWTRLANDTANPILRSMAQATYKPGAKPYVQFAFFAPDWTISNIRILARAFPAFNANERTRNLYMMYLINGAILYAILGNAVNYAFTGKSIFENKDPTRIDLGNGEVMTFSKQYMEPFHWITDPQKTLLKKTGSLPKTAAEILSNKEYLTTGWSPQITKKDDSSIEKALKLGGQVGSKFLPIWVNQAVEGYMEDGLTYDDALNVVLGQLAHPKYKGPRSTMFRTRELVEDPMKALF